MRRATVKAPHVPLYPDPIEVRAGERVALGRRDDEYPGWIWATAADGRAGWVPEALFEVAVDGDAGVARRDYSARELAVAAGDEVAVVEELAGWARVVAADGRAGWIPLATL